MPEPTIPGFEDASPKLTFYLNATRIVLDASTIDPDLSLLSFIRSQGLSGTKLGCGEGGCGACTVCLQVRNPEGRVQHLAVNACLMPLVAVDGKHIITVEALGDSDNPHPLQERMWKLSGSQCGFCTPGIVMSVYALLREASYRGALTVEDVELEGVLDGNLCRCTGYAPILAAVKSFVGSYLSAVNGDGKPLAELELPFNFEAAGIDEYDKPKQACCATKKDVSTDITLPATSLLETDAPPIDEQAGAMGRTAAINPSNPTPADPEPAKKNGCGRADCCQLGGTGEAATKGAEAPKFPRFEFKKYTPGTELIFPPSLSKHVLAPLRFGNSSRLWLRPTTLSQLLAIKAADPTCKLIGGSSEVAIEVGILGRNYPVSVYIADIPELYAYTLPNPEDAEPKFTFGANLALSELESLCKKLAKDLPEGMTGPVKAVRDQLRYFAGRQIRNTASVGGNIATASPISDLNPVWIATSAQVVAQSLSQGTFTLPLADFFVGYRTTTLPADAVIVSVVLPLFNPSSSTGTENQVEVVRAYKQAKRKDDDISIVCACLSIKVDKEDQAIKSVKLAYGGMAPFTTRAKKTEEFLLGKPVNSATLESALDVLAEEFSLPFDVPGGFPAYRRTLTLSFFFKFFLSVSVELGLTLEGDFGTNIDGEITESIHRGISTSSRDNSDPYALEVVGRQELHASGLKHVTGEAIYVDDMPSIAREAQLYLVLSTRAHARILSVDPSAALELEGVLSYISHKDLPSAKANCWGAAAIDELFFAVDEVTSHGQIIGAVVADTKLNAMKGARLVKVEYEDLPVVLTIEEAMEEDSYHPQYDRRIARGDEIGAALAVAELTLEGTTRLGGQEHFYLETMAAFVVPKGEGGEVDVYASTQALTDTQRWVAQVTGVPRNRVVAHSKRLGGGFGGKETRTAMLSVACAVAAKKLKRPVRAMLDRDVDIRTTGQRNPIRADWKVGFTKEGKITALDCMVNVNAGYSLDISGGVADRTISHVENSYFIPHVDVRARCCKTNTVSNTAFRGFGGPQGMIIAEHYVEAISDHLGLDIDHVREINLYKEAEETPYHQQVLDWHVPRMLKEVREEANYEERKAAVDAWNEKHRYRKRGISLIPTKFGLAFGLRSMNQGAALVHIYLDGSVLIAHGGTEMGQGLYTKCAQVAAQDLGVPLSSIFNSESATNTVPNTVPTAASAGSDLNGAAIANACAELNKRLEPIRARLGPDATMAELAGAAWGDRISLSATGYFATPDLGYVWNCQERTGNLFHYFTQGVALAEVELDTLTGDSTVLRVDLKMDVGKSLNPAIDMGQIEGAFIQGQGWVTIEESLWLSRTGALATVGPGAYKIPGFADIPQVFNVSLLKDAEWPNLGSIKASKGVGEPPFFLGCSVALALRQALKSARKDVGITEFQEFRLPMTSERLRLACGDPLRKRGDVQAREGQKGFFVAI